MEENIENSFNKILEDSMLREYREYNKRIIKTIEKIDNILKETETNKNFIPKRGQTIYYKWKGQSHVIKKRIKNVISSDISNILELDDFIYTEYPDRYLQEDIEIIKIC